MNQNTRSWKTAIWSAVGLFVLHILGTVLFAALGANVLQAMNIFGIFLGTLTLLAGIWLAFEKVAVKIVLTIAALFLSLVMPTAGFVLDSLFSTNWIAFIVNGIGIVFLCPIALMLVVHYWPTKTAAVEVKKETISLEPVPAPHMVTAEDAYYRMLERISHKLSFALKGAQLEDPAESAFLLDITSLHLLIEQQIAVLFSAYNDGVINDDTDAVLPLLVVDEHIEK